jgi:acetyl/propionyl-CoA carboxylase alpha subunit
MEVRVYAEDPAAGFLPSVGRLAQWIEPSGPGVRVDSGVMRGSAVTPYYDPMLAKLIVRGATREETLARLERALREFSVLGVQTNISYLLAILRHPDFRAGNLSTEFLAEHFAGWKPPTDLPVEALLALAAESLTYRAPGALAPAGAAPEGDPYSPWRAAGHWRNAR